MVQPHAGRATIEANRENVRAAHEQRLTRADAKLPERFDHTQFIAYVDTNSIKFDKFGTMSITFRTPPEYRDNAMALLNAAGLLLSVDVQRWNVVPSEDDEGDDGDGDERA